MKKPAVPKKTTVSKKKHAVLSAGKKQTEAAVTVETFLAPLMPELEEFVKKDPHRLIGCGG